MPWNKQGAMGTASIHEGVRRMRFSDLLDRTDAKDLTQEAASEILGISARTFQRWSERYEADGDDRLVDRRMGWRSPKRARQMNHTPYSWESPN
jgi:transposase